MSARMLTAFAGAAAAVVLWLGAAPLLAQHAVTQRTDGRPDAIVDLRTVDGARLVNAQWRYSDVRLIEADFNAPAADLRPSGPAIKTYDYTPKAIGKDYDDSGWEAIAPPPSRRGAGTESSASTGIARRSLEQDRRSGRVELTNPGGNSRPGSDRRRPRLRIRERSWPSAACSAGRTDRSIC